MANFTPGPWALGFAATSDFDGEDKNGRPIRKKHIVWQAVESADGSRVATTGIYVQAQNKPSKRITAEESTANANLIAAAPKMHQALRSVLEWFDTWEIRIGTAEECLLTEIRSALQEADGGKQ